jgi:low temperature requirement protein LtrA
MISRVSVLPERAVRVSTLELFFDLVFVFTMTQLTGVLVEGGDLASLLQVVVMFHVIWWMYDGYAWLTNAIATDRVRYRLLLLGGMGGFLVIALATPRAFESDGLAFAVGWLVVVALHAGMYVKGASIEEVAAILRIVPFNLVAVVLVLVGGALGGDAQWFLWSLTAAMLWITPWLTSVEGFVISVSHFVERHGLVVIVALGESVVVIGAGVAGLPLDLELGLAALVSLALSAALWWTYFSDEGAIEEAMHAAPPEQRPRLALVGFGYWHIGVVLGVVALAAGLKKAVGAPTDPLDAWIAFELAAGVALFVACDVGFRRSLGLPRGGARLAAAALAFATIPIGTEFEGKAQIAALAAIVVAALLLESRSTAGPGRGPDPAVPAPES